jgi:serine/threonine-protein kinase HipA
MNTFKPLFIYLQRPDNGEWVTVGRYQVAPDGAGLFRYAPSYFDAGLSWSIDPVNLPFDADMTWSAPRYGGLHDVLRDACPDAWGQALLRREYQLPDGTPMLRYLALSNNSHRWGALAVGTGRYPSIAAIGTPKLRELEALVDELRAMSAHEPSRNSALRRRLIQTASVGGARPKATVRDSLGQFWLVKPRIATDIADIPRLEHMAQYWGRAAGLNFAETVLHADDRFSAVRVLRFDRQGDRRFMCVSSASLLQAEYPAIFGNTDRWSYVRLAERLRKIGAPEEDGHELFGRMVFNAVCGNDDDHVRNHAVYFRPDLGGWRLTPAFDVVPNPLETPRQLAMQLATFRFDIARSAMLEGALRFGFGSQEAARAYLDTLLDRIEATFDASVAVLDADWATFMRDRLQSNLALLRQP